MRIWWCREVFVIQKLQEEWCSCWLDSRLHQSKWPVLKSHTIKADLIEFAKAEAWQTLISLPNFKEAMEEDSDNIESADSANDKDNERFL